MLNLNEFIINTKNKDYYQEFLIDIIYLSSNNYEKFLKIIKNEKEDFKNTKIIENPILPDEHIFIVYRLNGVIELKRINGVL